MFTFLVYTEFTEKPYNKPLEGNIVYIPITSPSHAASVKSE